MYVNGKHVPLPATAMMSYEITSKDAIPEFDNAEQWNVSVSTTDSFIKYNAPLTKEEAEYYSHVKGIKEVKKILLNSSTDTFGLAKSSNGSEWTIDNYGPLIIPGTGETITVDEFNFNLYKNIPEIKMGKQLLRENLFFVLGDNRHRAQDSRYNGFISLSNMYGVVNK